MTAHDQVTLYYHPQSRARTVMWVLEEIGVPYEVKLVRFDKGEHKTPEFLAKNPMGKLPLIEHRGVVVTEVAAIIAYLADAFPAAKLAPALDDPRRGPYYRWLFFSNGVSEPALTDQMFKRPPVDRPSAIGYGTFDDTVNALEGALTPGPWVLGETFGAADIAIGSQLGFAMMMKVVEPRPAFGAYLQRIGQRPAYQAFEARSQSYEAQLKS